MNAKLAARLDAIAPFHVMELLKMAAVLEQQGRSVIHMGIGEPDFSAAQPVLDAAAAAIAGGTLRYTHAAGLPALREAIAAHYRERFGLEIAADRIIITAGASGALLLACAALVGREDEVLMPDPSYPCNRHFVTAFEGKARLIPSGPAQRFQLSAAMVREHWSPSTRGVLLASPSNPTGTSIATTELRDIAELVRERGGFTVVDEIYQGLSYDAPPFSALSLGEDVIVINSFSKYFNMTGWRLGWLVAPPTLVLSMERLQQSLAICAPTLSQKAALAAFDARDELEDIRAGYARSRAMLLARLPSLGLDAFAPPDGAFYFYIDISAFTDDSTDFCRRLLHEAGVATTPGRDFDPARGGQWLRLSYAGPGTEVAEGVERLAGWLGRTPPG